MVNDKYVVKYLDPRTGKYEYATVKDVGDLQKLNTKVKTSIVDAINSISANDIEGLKNGLDTIGKTIKSLEDGTLELGDFQSIDDVVSREIEDAINSLKDENSGLLKLTQEEIDKIVSDAESEYRDSIAASVRELETSKSDLEDAREKMTSIGQMLENADIDYSNLTQTVDDINLYIEDVIEKTDFDMVNGIVSDYKTAVTQSKDGWGVDASKNMLSYLTGRVKNNETSLDVQHGLIQAKVGKDEFQYMTVDNLPAGKENMLHNTSDLRDWDFSSAFIFKSADDYRFTSIVQSDSAGENIIGTTDELEQGVTYAISAYVNVQNKNKKPNEEKYAPTDGDYTATVIIDGDTIELNNVVEDNSALDGWKRVSGTFIAKRTAKQDIKFYVTAFNRNTQVGYLSAPKLEKGSSATSWIPHIEDNVSTILSQNAVMRVLSDRITSSVEEVRETKGAFETATSTFDQMADGFELNTNKLSEVLDKYGEVTGVQTQQASELKVLNESITSKVWKQDINTTLDTINIDTSNRIVNSAFNIYSYDEQTGALQLDYWDNNTGFEIKKHSQSLDNYLYAKRSNATSVNPISIKSSPFALRDGEKILFNFEYLAVGNPLDNDNVITLEMYDNNDVRVGLQEFKLSELKKEFLTAYDVGDSYKYNGSYIVKNSSVVKGTITLKLPKNGELWITKVMLQNAGIGTIGWTPSSIDNQIIQSKLSTEINQLADSIELVAKDERLDAISGLLVKKDGKITISPEAIVSRVTSQELGEKGLITQTSLKQTEDNLRFDLVDKDGIIQTINASADGLLIDFDKVQIDGEVIARMISAQSIDATQGFRLTDNNGNTLLSVVNDNGKPTLNIAKDFDIKFKDVSNKLDVTIVNVVDEYYHSTSQDKPVGGRWTSAPNDFRGDTFVWKRTKVVLQSGKEHYLPDKNGINITSGWNYAKGEVTNAIEVAQEEADKAVQAAKDADERANSALEKAGANANLLTTHQNTIDTINTTTLPAITSSAQDALANAKSAMDEAKKADGKIADFVKTNGLVSGTTVDSKIDDATGAISKTIRTVEGKIDGLQVGGRNLFQLADFDMLDEPTTYGQNLISTSTKAKSIMFNSNNKYYEPGKYTLSFEMKVEEGYTESLASVRLSRMDYTSAKFTSMMFLGGGELTDKWKKITYTFSIEEPTRFRLQIYNHNFGTKYNSEVYTRHFKLEKGNIATDWTLAPEDIYTQEEFKIFESTYDEDVKGIRSSLTALENDKLDGSTYTTFYKNEYEKTAQGLKDSYDKIGKVVDENGNTTDTFAKAVYDQNYTRRKEDFDEVTKDLVKEATYTAGINGLSGSIGTISGRLDKLTVGGRNYALKSNIYYYTTDYKVSEYDLSKIPKGTKIKVSVWGGLSSNVRTFGAYINNGNGTTSGNSQIIELTKLDGVFGQGASTSLSKWTGEAALNVDATKILIFGLDNESSSPKRVEYVKVETGGAFTDWTIAPEDMLGKADFQVFKTTYEANDKTIKARLLAVDSGKEGSIAYRLNETEKTASGNTTTISDIKTKPGEQITGYQTIKERSDLYERVIGKDEAGIKNNMARMVMTDSLFKTEVIKNVPSAIGGRNYVLKSDEYYYTNNYKVAEYDLSTIPKGTKIKISIWGGIGSTVRTFGVYVNNSSGTASGNSQIIELKKLDGVFGQGASVPLAKWTAEATLNVDAKKILIYGLDNNNSSPKRVEYVQIETGDYYTDWTAAPEDKANMSSITQLEDSISLKVSSEELLNEINVQAKGILIQSGTNKLNITPDTTFIQDATIKSAMLESVEADKITTGTFDASKAKIINLDAESITSNQTSFVQSAWNGINNTVSVNASGIRSANTNGDWTLYHSGAISFGGGSSQGIYLEYADGTRNGLAINNRGALNTEITLDLMSSARNTMNFGRRTDTNGYDFRIDHYQGTKVSFDGRGVQRYTFNVNSDAQSHAISILGHGATSGYNKGSSLSIGMETADGRAKGSRFYFSSNSDLVWLGKDSYGDLKPLAVSDLQFRWGENGRKSMKEVLERLSKAVGVDINNIPDVY